MLPYKSHLLTTIYLSLILSSPTLQAFLSPSPSNLNFTLGTIALPPRPSASSSSKSPPSHKYVTHILHLDPKPGLSSSAGYIQALRSGIHRTDANANANPNPSTTTNLNGNSNSNANGFGHKNGENGVYGLTPVTYVAESQVLAAYLEIGGQGFEMQIDTGSSDTWVVGKGFECSDSTSSDTTATTSNDNSSDAAEESACKFGPRRYDKSASSTFRPIANENFHILYSDGTAVTGKLGKETVTVAGIPVSGQEFAVVDHATIYNGDGITSGLIGLAFPALTSAYTGTDPTKKGTKQIVYNPILTTLFGRGYVAPVFSLAIRRSSITSGIASSGLLAIGGLPPVLHDPHFAVAPFQLVTINTTDGSGLKTTTSQYLYYTIIVQGFTYTNSDSTNYTHPPELPNPLTPPTNRRHLHAFVDSGTTLIYLPNSLANAVNALFDPPAVYDVGSGLYVANCSAQAPEFGIDIDGRTFFINARDMIVPVPGSPDVCVSGIADVGFGMSTLGTVFLRSVLAVFDVGASEMRFAAREFY